MRKNYEERDKKIIELSEQYSQKEVGLIYGLTQGAIGRILKKNGIKREKKRLNLSKLSLNVDYFKDIDEPKKAYWLGYICADGCIQKNNDKLSICCKDLEILEKFKKDVNSGHKIIEKNIFDKRTNKYYHEYSFQIGNVLFVKNIIEQGVTHNKTNVCSFPNIREEFYSYFIAGLFDGDGSVFFKAAKNKVLGCSLISTKEILNFINNYLQKEYNIKPRKLIRITENKENVYKCYWDKYCINFLDFIYGGDKDIYLSRKYEKYINNRHLKPTRKRECKILKYTLEGDYVGMFDNAVLAAESVGGYNSSIIEAIRKKTYISHGFYWDEWEEGEDIKQKIDVHNKIEIHQYDLNGNFIKKYYSIANAAKENGIKKDTLYRYFYKKETSCGGYIWKKI